MNEKKPFLDNSALRCKWFLPLLIAVIAVCCIICTVRANHSGASSGTDNNQTAESSTTELAEESMDEKLDNSMSAAASGVYMTVTDYKDGIATVLVSNQSGASYDYPASYSSEKQKDDGSWEELETQDIMFFPQVLYPLEDDAEEEVSCDLTPYGELKRGQYRLVKGELTAEFTLQ